MEVDFWWPLLAFVYVAVIVKGARYLQAGDGPAASLPATSDAAIGPSLMPIKFGAKAVCLVLLSALTTTSATPIMRNTREHGMFAPQQCAFSLPVAAWALVKQEISLTVFCLRSICVRSAKVLGRLPWQAVCADVSSEK